MVGTTKVYSGVGADIVMESITLKAHPMSAIVSDSLSISAVHSERNGEQMDSYTTTLPRTISRIGDTASN